MFARDTFTCLSILTAPLPAEGGVCGRVCVELPVVPPPEHPAKSAPASAKIPAQPRARLIHHGLDSMLRCPPQTRECSKAGTRAAPTVNNLQLDTAVCEQASASFLGPH